MKTLTLVLVLTLVMSGAALGKTKPVPPVVKDVPADTCQGDPSCEVPAPASLPEDPGIS